MGEFDPAYIAHSTPTRLRLRVPARRHDRAYFDALVRRLETRGEIRRVEASPITASVTITVRHPIDWSSLRLSTCGLVILDRGAMPHANLSRAAPVSPMPAAPANGGVDPAGVIVQIASFMLTGRPLAALLQWLAERLLQRLLGRLLQAAGQPA